MEESVTKIEFVGKEKVATEVVEYLERFRAEMGWKGMTVEEQTAIQDLTYFVAQAGFGFVKLEQDELEFIKERSMSSNADEAISG